jgi:CubicO group peptidase (beta-lactamase class C family)
MMRPRNLLEFASATGLFLTVLSIPIPAHAAKPSSVIGKPIHNSPVSDGEIRRMLATRVDVQKRATGIVVAVTDPSGHRTIAYGFRGLEDRRPVNERTVYDIGSLTKVFTALLLAKEVEQGHLKLNEPVRDCVAQPTGLLAPTGGREVTFADLATHTSGLPLRPDNLRSTDPENKYAGYTEQDLLKFLSTFKSQKPPGTAYDYSNVGYGLLGVALSRCNHQDYATLVRTRITAPLGMNDTAIEPTADMRKREATGYDMDFKLAPHWDFGALAAAGSLRSTADDLIKFLDAAIGLKPSVLTPSFREMTSVERAGGMQPASAIALGWNIYRDHGLKVVWKNGSVGGFRAFMGYETTSRTGVVALANMQTAQGVDDIGLHILDSSYPVDLTAPRAHLIVKIDPTILDQYVGTYSFSATDTVSIRRDVDHLVVIAQGTALPIAPEGHDRFYLKLADAELTFRAFAGGLATELVWHQNGADEIARRVR